MERCKCPNCGMPTIEQANHLTIDDMFCDTCERIWSGEPDQNDPDNYWIEDQNGIRVPV